MRCKVLLPCGAALVALCAVVGIWPGGERVNGQTRESDAAISAGGETGGRMEGVGEIGRVRERLVEAIERWSGSSSRFLPDAPRTFEEVKVDWGNLDEGAASEIVLGEFRLRLPSALTRVSLTTANEDGWGLRAPNEPVRIGLTATSGATVELSIGGVMKAREPSDTAPLPSTRPQQDVDGLAVVKNGSTISVVGVDLNFPSALSKVHVSNWNPRALGGALRCLARSDQAHFFFELNNDGSPRVSRRWWEELRALADGRGTDRFNEHLVEALMGLGLEADAASNRVKRAARELLDLGNEQLLLRMSRATRDTLKSQTDLDGLLQELLVWRFAIGLSDRGSGQVVFDVPGAGRMYVRGSRLGASPDGRLRGAESLLFDKEGKCRVAVSIGIANTPEHEAATAPLDVVRLSALVVSGMRVTR